jgi:hypothetical protein
MPMVDAGAADAAFGLDASTARPDAAAPDAAAGLDASAVAGPDAGSCTSGTACTPVACHSGTITCATGTPVCMDTGSAADGTGCGANQVCTAGICDFDYEWALWPLPPETPIDYAITPTTVKDNVTQLTWEAAQDAGTYTMDQAASYCASLGVGALTWHLPTAIELLSIVSSDVKSLPAVNTAAFPSMTNLSVWTSSRYASPAICAGCAWVVELSDGMPHMYPTSDLHGVLCVSRSATPSLAHYSIANGMVMDNWTGLTWQQSMVLATASLSEADNYCQQLTLGSATGWRMPQKKELESIVDRRTFGPAIDTAVFPGESGRAYWTASPYQYYSVSKQWVVDFGMGLSGFTDVSSGEAAVRCVR